MAANGNTLEYLRAGVENLLEHGSFRNGRPFRPTQNDALYAYRDYLNRDDITDAEKLSGFFVLPTGTGKTALFLAIVDEAHAVGREKGDRLRTMIVVPTRLLLQQTYDAIAEWAPDYLGKVGRYGDNHKQLGKELSLVIYNSWVTLMEQGKIDSSKIDILVSDEAHRGTSERRLTEKFNAFSNGTAQIAFTATAHFDEEKSVEQSHGNLVFERSLPDAVRLDELAAYIQTQLHIIRVAPREDTTSEIRAGMRQEAWIRNMVDIFRDGRDELTGDLLSDNKSGFYVGDTAMADRTAHLLRADPVLQERAKAKGCKGVAVSIHSNMLQQLQDDLLEAFKRGEYMACVSDSKLKEGFDDPTLKNVFDYPRGSLVDKAQIMGRAARKWFNEVKDRYEGATIVDTIVYIGSDDPEEDRRFKEDAIRKAIMAWSVLEGTVVFSEKEEELVRARKANREGGGFGSPVLGMDVESFVTLEEVQAIHARQQELLEDNRIPLTDEMRSELKHEMNRTGLVRRKIISAFLDVPDSITAAKIQSWLYVGKNKIKTVDAEEWKFIINGVKALPDKQQEASAETAVEKHEKDVVSITEQMRTAFFKERERTGVMSRSIAKILEGVPENYHARIENIRTGRIKNFPKPEWDRLMAAYAALPDLSSTNAKIAMTDEMHAKLLTYREQAGLGSKALLNGGRDIPEGLTAQIIQKWVLRRTATVNVAVEQWDWVIAQYEEHINNSGKAKPKGWVRASVPSP